MTLAWICLLNFILSTCGKLWCLSAHKSTSLLTSFLRHCKYFTNLPFQVLWAWLTMPTTIGKIVIWSFPSLSIYGWTNDTMLEQQQQTYHLNKHRVWINFSKLYCEKLYGKNLLILVSPEGPLWLSLMGRKFYSFPCCRLLENPISNIN